MEGLVFLKKMVESTGVSGHEGPISKVIKEYFEPLCDEVKQDKLGNLVAYKKGNRRAPNPFKIMIAAHMDEIGLMVKEIDDRGFIRFTSIGGVDQRTILAQEVIIHGKQDVYGVIGAKPPHLSGQDDRSKAVKMEDMVIDVGLNKDQVEEIIQIGDVITLKREYIDLSSNIGAAKAMDDRAGVAVMYECLKELERLSFSSEIYFVSTVQEEVGTRGAIVSTYSIEPDIGIAVDVGFGHTPELSKEDSLDMGKGPGIALGGNIHPALYKKFVEVAREYSIDYQTEVAPGPTGTDAWAMQVSQGGVATAVISIPLRYMHTSVETLDYNDVKKSGRLLAYFIAELDKVEREGFLCY